MMCEICGNKADSICPRCYRFICNNCTDPITLYCIDCSSFKKFQEEDYLRYTEYLGKKVKYMLSIFDKKECMSCPLYKDSVMSTLRKIKELEHLSKLENFEKVSEKVYDIKNSLQSLAINYIIKYVKKDKS